MVLGVRLWHLGLGCAKAPPARNTTAMWNCVNTNASAAANKMDGHEAAANISTQQ